MTASAAVSRPLRKLLAAGPAIFRDGNTLIAGNACPAELLPELEALCLPRISDEDGRAVVALLKEHAGRVRTKRVHPKTGKIFCPGGTRLQRMGMRKGVPDLVILHSGRIMGLEVKSPGGILSREQKEFRVEWERAGGIYAVVRSVEEGTALLEEWEVVTASGVGLEGLEKPRRWRSADEEETQT